MYRAARLELGSGGGEAGTFRELGWGIIVRQREEAIVDSVTDVCTRFRFPQVTKELAARVFEHSSKGQLTVTLGGDHSLVSSL
mgnify:FL=1